MAARLRVLQVISAVVDGRVRDLENLAEEAREGFQVCGVLQGRLFFHNSGKQPQRLTCLLDNRSGLRELLPLALPVKLSLMD